MAPSEWSSAYGRRTLAECRYGDALRRLVPPSGWSSVADAWSALERNQSRLQYFRERHRRDAPAAAGLRRACRHERSGVARHRHQPHRYSGSALGKLLRDAPHTSDLAWSGRPKRVAIAAPHGSTARPKG